MTGRGRHVRLTKLVLSVLSQFEYPALIAGHPVFISGLKYHNEDGYRCDNPYEKGTPERYLWRAGWDYGNELKRSLR